MMCFRWINHNDIAQNCIYLAVNCIQSHKCEESCGIEKSYNGMLTFVLETASVAWWSEFLATDLEVRVRFPALPETKSNGSGAGSTQPREYN
jgi:hypothetical protein